MAYPVEAVLPDLLAILAKAPNAVLIAPPGAGKTTMVAPAMLDQPWCNGKILLLSPRRIAARMAAERIAELTGENIGGRVGYATRMDTKQSADTRLLVLTEGIFRNMIIADPELGGISAIIFDEVHERSLDSDFGLALALEAQGVFRPDLRLLAMSATLDGDRFAGLMGTPGQPAALIESAGKSWPLELCHVGRRAELPIERDVAGIIRRALTDNMGDILVFLPGVREIERVAGQLGELGEGIIIHQLYGNLDPVQQRAALVPDGNGRRKIILATNIAETSLTIDGVRIVIDSGMARRARYDQVAGVTRLVTERASLSAATQRAGRAARQGAGTAYRIWEEAGNGGLPPFDPPEILESNLASLVLDCASWGENNPARLRWLDLPPAAALAQARKALRGFGALDDDGRVTPHGRDISVIPLPPHLANMTVVAAKFGRGEDAATLALLTQERGLGGQGDDLELRFDRFGTEAGFRAVAARKLAKRIAKMAGDTAKDPETALPKDESLSVGAMLAAGFPDFVAKRRDAKGENWLTISGRGLRLDPASSLTGAHWLAVADMQGAASGARIMSAAPISEEQVEMIFGDRIERVSQINYDRQNDRISAKQSRKLGAVTLSEMAMATPDPAAVSALLVRAVRDFGLDILPWSAAAHSLRQRAAFAGQDILSDAMLHARLDEWLTPAIGNARRIGDISGNALLQALENMLGWDIKQKIDKIAPPYFASPAGTRHEIDYAATAGPGVELRVQALFGLDEHPHIGIDEIPLVLSLTSPAGRPIQTTRDLPAFWRGSWHDVAKEMRGRYPKHAWPETPWQAQASLKTKKAQGRDA